MSYSLHVPYNDIDLPDGSRDINVDITGVGSFTFDIGKPSSVGSPLEGGVVWNSPPLIGVSIDPFSLLSLLLGGLFTNDPENPNVLYTVQYSPDVAGDLPLRLAVRRTALPGGTAATWSIRWGNVLSTIDSSMFGWDGTDMPYTADSTFALSPYQVGRTWYHRYPQFLPGIPKHRGDLLTATDGAGVQQLTNTGATSTKNILFNPPNIEGARLFHDIASELVGVNMVLGMSINDPNVPLEALVEAWRLGRKPTRWVKDPYQALGDAVVTPLQVDFDKADFLRDMQTLITDRKAQPRFYSVEFGLQEYVSP